MFDLGRFALCKSIDVRSDYASNIDMYTKSETHHLGNNLLQYDKKQLISKKIRL